MKYGIAILRVLRRCGGGKQAVVESGECPLLVKVGSATLSCQSATFFIAAEIAFGVMAEEMLVASGPGLSGALPDELRSTGTTADFAGVGVCAGAWPKELARALSTSMPRTLDRPIPGADEINLFWTKGMMYPIRRHRLQFRKMCREGEALLILWIAMHFLCEH